MIAGMFTLGTPLWQIAIRTGVVYIAVLTGFRVFGKREVGQLTLADLVLLILIANAVQNAMVGPDTSLEGGLFAALVLLLVNMAIGYLRVRSTRLDRAFQGQPIPLVTRGQVIDAHLRREGLDASDLERVAHENQLGGLADIDSAWLETDGTISIVPKSHPPLRASTHRPRSRRRAKGLRKPTN
jgi:uncharacterized membrane protein YcaP (DUF421 family)